MINLNFRFIDIPENEHSSIASEIKRAVSKLEGGDTILEVRKTTEGGIAYHISPIEMTTYSFNEFKDGQRLLHCGSYGCRISTQVGEMDFYILRIEDD